MKKFYLNVALLLLLFTLFFNDAGFAGSMKKIGSDEILSPKEEAGLLFMREEEKLARDVYQVLSAKWGLRVFENIAESEQQHMDAILYLLGKYDLEDPALGPGEFDNSDLQKLYNYLVAKGEASVVDAIEVGVTIEETDIEDITNYLNTTDKNDIINVYTNLLEGSYNHLEAFESHLPFENQ